MSSRKRKFSIKNSIRTEFAVIFIIVMVLTIMGYWIINNIFLQKYYIEDKQKRLTSTYNSVDELAIDSDTESEEFKQTFYKICSASGLNAAIVTSGLKTVYSTTGENDILIVRLLDHVFDADKERDRTRVLYKNDRYEICTSKDPRINLDYLELWGNLSTGDIIIMRTPLSSIRESVSVSNRFLGYVGFIMILISAVIIWFVTGKITKPIEELADLSEKMSALDFDAKYESGGNNEIGVLGEHMNELSGTLEKTISELKTSNNELKRDIEKKEKQNSMRLEFLSNVAHELKTPIALIQGYAEGLKDDVADDEESRDYYCDVIIDESDKMNKLVKDLMTLNELEFGGDRIDLKRFDVTGLIRGCIEANDLPVKQKDIRVIFDVDKPMFVWSDEFKTEEVIQNYLSNAIHYCDVPASGGIEADKKMALSEEKYIKIDIEEKGDILRVTVFNTGEPVPEESLPRLFEKFYKVDKARTREYGGSGVGLSIVKAIMDSLHRDCGVENHHNGVSFWFELDCNSKTDAEGHVN